MRIRILSLVLAIVLLYTIFPFFSFSVFAATELSATPNPKVEYGYTTDTPVGTIRYIAQNTGSEYFNWNYWPANSIDPDGDGVGYFGPSDECGTACISMALSYVGVNRTPKVLLEATNGITANMWGQQGDATSKTITISQSGVASAMNDYISGEGKYSPLCIYIVPFSATSNMHWVLLVGKISENKYLALNPWHSSGTNGTFTITINGTTASYNGLTNPITSVNQWYNPNATPPVAKKSYPAYCAIKVSSSTTYIKSLPCSAETDASSTNVEKAYKGDQYQAIGLVENTAGNLWYKVTAKNGSVGYMYAGDTTYIAQSINDIKGSGITAPTNHTAEKIFILTGTISSTYNQLTKVSAYVHAGSSEQGSIETGASDSVSGNSYSLGGSPIDSKTEFNRLPVGTHTYVVKASYKNYYAKSARSLGTNTGEIGIYKAVFNVTSAAASCSHSYTSKVTTEATCTKNGVRTYTCSKCGASYTEVIPATGNHSYSSKVTTAATCTSNGVRTYTCSGCSASYTESIPATGHSYGNWVTTTAATCTANGTQKRTCASCGGSQTQSIPATGHSYGSWVTTSNPGCTTAGSQKRTCSSCGNVQTQSIAAIGHDYQPTVIGATCTDYEKIRYTCSTCQDYYEEYTNDLYSDWSTTKPTGIADELIETKTQYRYSDYETKTSYDPNLSGYTLISSTWETSSSGTVVYVKSWPSGFSTNHSLYSTYNKTAKTNSETTTNKTTVNSDKISGYLYYHWCRGTYTGGPINRATSPTQSGEFNSFHAFYSTTPPSSLTASPDGDGSYTYGNGSCCKDSHWYYCVSVYTQTYTTYRKLFTYGRWGSWSNWSDTVYTANSNRKVETRTLYRYVNSQLGDHVWNSGVETSAPTCTEKGVKTYTCSACGTTKTEDIAALGHNYQDGYCTRCGAEDPNYQFVPVKLEVGTAAGKPGDTVTVPVSISDNSGFAGFTFVISYDASVMTLTDITKGDVLAGSECGAFTKNVSGGIINWTDATNVTGNGTVFSLVFKISDQTTVEECKVELALKDGNSTNFVDENGRAKRAEITAGEVLVTPHSHEYTAEVVAPTCTEQGYTTYTCSCGDSYKDNYTSPLGHNYGYIDNEDETWESEGTHRWVCTTCGVTIIDWDNHTWDDGVISTEPTCEMPGFKTFSCILCGATKIEDFWGGGHNFVTLPEEPATCTEPGLTQGVECSICGEYVSGREEIPALGHNYSYKVTTTPTTSATGKLTGTCSRCSGTTTVALPKLNTTDYTYKVTKEATCTATGTGRYTWKTTTYGNFYFDVTIDKTPHDYKATITAPTCTAQGYTTHTCSTCGNNYVDSYVAALGHAESDWIVDSNATCTASGSKHTQCTRCGVTMQTSVILATGHNESEWIVDKNATCTASGSKHTECLICGTTLKTAAIPARGHSYQDYVTAPTCTERGYTTHICDNCNDSYVDSYVNALGHEWDEGSISQAPTCTQDGIKVFNCNRCSETKTESVAAIGHSYADIVTVPTCTEEGYTTHTCGSCGDSFVDSYTDALGHDWNEGTVTTEPTETETGIRTYTCERCAETKTEEVPVLEHTHSYAESVIAPTCTEQGYTVYSCACGDSYTDNYVAALGHAWDDGKVTTEPTATEAGVMTYTCTREGCGETKTEEIPALGEDPDVPCDGGADCPSAHFTDIHATDWYHEAVDFAVENGLFGGMSANTFEPNTAMTRAMLVTVLWRYAGEPAEGENTFTDVPAGQWYTDAVAWAAFNNIVGGVGDNKFDPNGNITREQMATILYRYANGQDIDTSARADLSAFPDAGSVSSYANDPICWAVAEGLINGSDGKLMPQGNATRAQVATILIRFIENVVSK